MTGHSNTDGIQKMHHIFCMPSGKEDIKTRVLRLIEISVASCLKVEGTELSIKRKGLTEAVTGLSAHLQVVCCNTC